MTINILVADDISRMAYTLGKLAHEFGSVDSVTQMDLAREHMEKSKYDIIIADPICMIKNELMELRGNYKELAREVTIELKAHAPLILVFGGFSPEDLDVESGKHYDTHHYKPYYSEGLILQVKTLIR